MAHRNDGRLALALFLLVTILFGARAWGQYEPLTYLIGDCPYYAATSVSLLYDRDLDLRNQLPGGLAVHGRNIALAEDGTWYPKHPILMPVVSIPWLFAFGMPGFLVFNLLVLGSLAVTMMLLARPHAPPWAAASAAFVLITGTFLRRYDYNFSPDLFATLILTIGLLALVRKRDGLGGFMLGLAVIAKLSHLFLLPIGMLYGGWCRGWRAAARGGLGALGPILILAMLNLILFGSPLVTSYDRTVSIEDSTVTTWSHRGLFDNDLLQGLTGELLDLRHGLLPTAPTLLLALPGFVILLRRRPREALLYLAIAEFLLLLFATYRPWYTSHYGNRFLMPVISVATPAVALTLTHVANLVHTTMHRSRRASAPARLTP